MNSLSLFNEGQIAESVASVANNLIDKISAATGWVFSPKGLKFAQEEANKKLIDEISERTDICVFERSKLISMLVEFSKKKENIITILADSFDHLKNDANPQNISDDWIIDFIDKASKISDVGMQKLWSNLIADEANRPNSFSKKLLHVLFVMSYEDAENFLNLTRFCFYDSTEDHHLHPIIFLKKHPKSYQKSRITHQILNEMENLGLIECDYTVGFIFDNSKDLYYQNKKIRIEGKKIDAGNVRLSSLGQMLAKLSDKQNHTAILDFTIDNWSRLGCNVQVMRRDKLCQIKYKSKSP